MAGLLGNAAQWLLGETGRATGRTRVWLDMEQEGGGPKGRVILELAEREAPKLSRHFRHLVLGTFSDAFGRRLHYAGSQLHAVHPVSGLILGGDIVHGNGAGAVAADPEPGRCPAALTASIKPDKRILHFDKEGTLAAAGLWDGPHRPFANSQFMILTKALPGGALDYPDCVPFGRVVAGLSLLRDLDGHPVSGLPTRPVRITGCGVFD